MAAAFRFGIAVYRAPSAPRGDFAVTLPGAYARTLNPTLWNSPDLSDSYGYQKNIYVYGPTQYLALYPLVFLNSYAQIAKVLSWVYAVVLAWSLYLTARLIVDDGRAVFNAFLSVAAVTLMFPPTYQVY